MTESTIAFLAMLPMLLMVTLMALAWLVCDHVLLTECPCCSERLYASRFREGLPCPKCGHTLQENSQHEIEQHDSISEANGCHHCDADLQADSMVRLWDGHCYCQDCVGRESDALLEQARNGEQLREEFGFSRWELARDRIKYVVIAILCFTAFVALCNLAGGQIRLAFGLLIIVPCVLIPPAVVIVIVLVYSVRAHRYSITVRDGKLIVQHYYTVVDYPLEECLWFEGKLSQMHIFKGYFFVRKPAIVFQMPHSWWYVGYHQAVGFSEESYHVWKAFLKLAEVPRLQKERKSKLRERIYDWWLSPCYG